jgi:predicted RNA-binding protein associated with RNAse of E/G family
MKVTESNLHYIVHLLSKCITNGFNIQTFYPEAKKQNSILKHFKIEYNFNDFLYQIEESNVAYFQQGIIEIEDTYIRIHNNLQSSTNFWEDNHKAMLINIGDEIKFNRGLITIRCPFVIHDAKCIQKITY